MILTDSKELDAVLALMRRAASVAICGHTSPDGDALGSVCAVSRLVRALNPDAQVDCLLADDVEMPRQLRFLPGADAFVHASAFEGDPELFICVDLSAAHRLNHAQAVMERSSSVAVIDHHPSGEPFWKAAAIRSSAASAGTIVFELFERAGVDIEADCATELLCALMTDTGCFQFQNADEQAFTIAAALVAAGASPSSISNYVYNSDSTAYLALEAKVLGRIETPFDGRVATSYTTLEDIHDGGVAFSECEGLIDLVRRVDGAEVALLLKEVTASKIRGSLRSKSDLDISVVARELGGGGHHAAAGFTRDGTIESVREEALELIGKLFSEG